MIRALSLCILAAGVAMAATAHAQTRLSADAGEVRDIRYASGSGASAVLYAATQGGGVFKSTNAGTTWAATGLNAGYAWKIAVSPLNTSRVYAATDAGLYRSDNAGTSWTRLTFDPARAVAINPGSVTNDTVLLGVPGQGVLRSINNGATYTMQSNGLDSADVRHIIYQAAGTAYVVLNCNEDDGIPPQAEGNWGGVFKSTNATSAGTISWANFNLGGGGTPLPTKCLRAIASNATRLFVGTQDPFTTDGEIYRTDGAGWTGANNNNPATGDMFGLESLAVDRNSATTIIAGPRNVGVRASTDNGVGYVQKADPISDPDTWTRIYAIETVPGLANTVLTANKGLGIMRTTVFANSPANTIAWNVAPGITADRVRALANSGAAPTTLWAGLEGGGVVKSTNSGVNWAQLNTGFNFGNPNFPDILVTVNAIAADPSNASIVLAGVRTAGLTQLNGSTWDYTLVPSSTQIGVVDHKPQQILMPASGQIYYTLFDGPAGGKAGGLLRSTSGPGGLTQTLYPADLLSCGTSSPATGSARKVVQASAGVAYLLRHDALPYRSPDNFASTAATCVTAAHTGYERLTFHDITERPGSPNVLVAATSKGIFRSIDSGVNWARVVVTGLLSQVLSGVVYSGSNVFGVDRGGRFYCSTNNGDTWQLKSLGSLPPVAFREVKAMNGQLYILTDGGGVYTTGTTCP